jgi:acetylglutamate kinase
VTAATVDEALTEAQMAIATALMEAQLRKKIAPALHEEGIAVGVTADSAQVTLSKTATEKPLPPE